MAFTRGAAAVIFDGLDELVDVSRRTEISQVIESFIQRFPSTPVLVTSRVQGYEEAQLDGRSFELVRIEPFDSTRIRTYVERSFAVDGNEIPDLTPETSARLFLQEADDFAAEVWSNPLLLSLMCILYRGRGYVPENLSEVYSECAELLFERWDAHRQIEGPRLGARLRPLIERVAWWMYSEGLNEIGVAEEDLLRFCVEQVIDLKTDDLDEATSIARSFVDHCRGQRLGLFGCRSVGPTSTQIRVHPPLIHGVLCGTPYGIKH